MSLVIEKKWEPPQSKHVTHKLIFYAAHVATMPTPLLRSVADELGVRCEAFREESRTTRLGAVVEAKSLRKSGDQATEPLVIEL